MAKKTYNPIFGKPQQISLPKVDLQYSTPKKPESEKAEPPKTRPVVPVFSRQTTKANHIVPTNDRQRYREFTRQGYQQALQDNAGARFHAGFMEGLSPVSLGLESEALEGSKAFLAGNVAGTMAQFAIPYAGVAPKIGKALSNVPKYAQMGKVGQAVARGVGTDLAVGVPLNTLYGVSKEGLEGKELAKSIGLNTAIDLVAGGLFEIIPAGVKGMKRFVNKQTGEVVAEATDEVVEQAAKYTRRKLKQPLYTGSSNPNIESFIAGGDGVTKRSGDSFGKGVYLTDNPEVAKLYAQGDSGTVYQVETKSNLLDLDSNADKRFVDVVIGLINDGDQQYKNRLYRKIGRKRKAFDSVEDARNFFDEQKKIWGSVDSVYSGNKPKALKENNKFVVEYTDYNAEPLELLLKAKNKDIFEALSSINTNTASNAVMAAGFDGIKYADAGAFNAGIQGKTSVVFRNEKDINILKKYSTTDEIPKGRTIVPKPKKIVKVPQTPVQPRTPQGRTVVPVRRALKQSEVDFPDLPVKKANIKNEARNKGTHIEVGEKFEALSPEHQQSILVHENAHNLSNKHLFEDGKFQDILNNKAFGETKITSDGRTYWEGIFGDVGATSVDETLTEAIAIYKRNPEWLIKNHPEAYEYIKKNIMTKPFSTTKSRATVPNKSIGADNLRPQKTSEELIQEYGLIKPGMEPKAREARIPKATDAGDVQLGIRTSAEAKAINEQSYKEIQSAVEEGMATKFTVTNEKAVAEANKKIADNGLEKAHDEFRGFMQSGKMPQSKDIALGYRLMQEYQKAGDYKKVAELAIDISELLSETGRSLQAAQIIKKLSPEGRVLSVQRVAKKLSEKFDVDVKLDEATIKKVREAKTEKEIVEATEEAAIKAWNQVPSGLQNKLNAWRYMSMLMNPKTHVRNIVGNAIFMPARELKNLIGAGLEKAIVPVGKRTKAVINPASKADRELLKFADKDFDNVVNILRGEGKFDEGYRKLEANVFKNKILEGLRNFNMKALDVEDIWFMRAAYDSSMAQYLKANNINTKSITDELLQKARNYAADEALKATYRDANTVATAISKLKRKLATNKTDNTGLWLAQRAGGIALEGVLPFTKTPINILRRGVEYSPASIIAGIGDVIKVARKGGDMAKALDRLATGLSGTSILLIGALAGKNQWVVGGSDDLYSSKQYQYSNMQGMQEYAIDTGEGTYTIDWAAPMSMPFFVGVELGKAFEKEGADFSKVVDAITKIDDPLFNMSMLQGINDALNSWGKGDDAIGQIASNMIISYLGQYVPTVGGQIARTADDTRRAITSTTESPTKRKLEKALNRQLGKIPLAIAYQKNEPYIDLWGRTETSGSAVENFISPGYYRPKNVTFVDKEINKLIERLDEETAKEVIPRVTNSYTVTQDKVEYRMTEKELTQFKKTRGQTSYKELERLFRSGQYARMSDAEKVKAIRKVYDKAFQKAKEELLRKRASIPIKK
jgi:hypothetical protein